ncbi:MAG: WG repeat-containing protein [Clostridia bacterium]|nr:WG repeat-containing protein [Clostridia bacterium]
MKRLQKLLAILLCVAMTAAALTSCSLLPVSFGGNDQDQDQDHDHDHEAVDTEPLDIGTGYKDTENYKWVVVPSDIGGDIQPIYNIMNNRIAGLDVCFKTENGVQSIIGYDGAVKNDLPSDDFSYCAACECITNHYYTVTEPGYAVVENSRGHGGGVYMPYIYDMDSGKLYAQAMGEYSLKTDVDRAIVSVCVKYLLTEEEKAWSMSDYGYTNAYGYGIYVNGELVQSGYDMYTPYSCGVVALRDQNGKWGYFDIKGNEILPCEYDASAIEDYDLDYNLVNIPYHATEGILALCKDGKWGFADTRGNMLTDFEFEEARPVQGGKAWVKTSDGWGVIEIDHFYMQDSEQAREDYDACNHYMV